MTLSTMLYDHIHEDIKLESVNKLRDDNDLLKVIEEEQPVCEANIAEQDPAYIKWQIFGEMPERIFTIE